MVNGNVTKTKYANSSFMPVPASSQGRQGQDSFGMLMNQTAKADAGASNVQKPSSRIETKTDMKTGNESLRKDSLNQPKSVQGEGKIQDKFSQLSEKLEKTAMKLQKQIADALNVSEEDVQNAMAALGMNLMDLFQPDALAQLVVELTGASDMLSLVTDGELYASFQDLVAFMKGIKEELQGEFDLSEEEWNQLLAKVDEEIAKTQLPGEEVEETDSVVVEKEPDTLKGLQDTTGDQEVKTNVAIEEETTITSATSESQTGTNQNQDGTNKQAQNTTGEIAKSTESKSDVSKVDQGVNFLHNMSEQLQGKLDSILAEGKMPLHTADSQEIMRQMVSNLKLLATPQVTEMQMQLHPSSLGTVNLSVIYKDGALTAQFAAQNEAVKQALETQVIQLKETLQEQGVKVEAIEVTIQSHQFERNLQQGNSQQQDSNQKKQTRKRLVLEEGGIADMQDLDETEKLTAEMMVESGNTVDFTA